MNIIKRLRESVKGRFSKEEKAKNLDPKQQPKIEKANSSELYNSNEDLGFC